MMAPGPDPVPGTGYEAYDPAFGALHNPTARIERLWTGCRWAEGPAWFAGGRYLVWSDIPNDRMLRWDETDGSVSEFRRPSGFANGNTLDREGRLVTCEHGGRRVTRTGHDGRITVLADAYDGRLLNSPNDVAVAPDGAVWFTDPDYGILSDYEGHRAPREQDGCYLYRLAPDGTLALAATDFDKPNGLAFSPDGSLLYVADTGGSHRKDGPRHIRRFAHADGTLSGGEIWTTCTNGFFDGFRCDADGRVWSSASDGVHASARTDAC